jgi:tRNA-2-methylthio-N6-dimethylallyladenosine synthase
VRKNADNKLYGNLGQLAPLKAARLGMQIAVGGCLAQKDRSEITRRAPYVDVAFGTHHLGSLPVLLERARRRTGAGRDRGESWQSPLFRLWCRRTPTPPFTPGPSLRP